MIKRLIFLLVITAICIGLDQFTKLKAQQHLQSREAIVFLGGMARLDYAENKGAFLGMGSGLPNTARFWIFIFGAGLLLAGLCAYLLLKPLPNLSFVPMAMIFGGGISNWIDRAFRGEVVDFMNLGIGSLRTGIFNIADVAITFGVIFLLIFGSKQHKTEKGSPPHP